MTSGERMVFAAAFVRALADKRSRTEAVRMACSAVESLHDVSLNPNFREELNDHERAMLDDMLGTGENRKPAREPTHEHAFEGDGCDCALCGEGRAHYLHANGGDR